ncbi:hypothetical protein BDM02DRAFT_3118076 [Thelephora ganbajun]|uniref:Uncharacterized protein n=1 Tax=Thelephora ganbajun TaxID=370292 RepID=A0ACB6ZBB2_THEGA|nr:hypothetical protein BDM02DRAFT_3118076 [Thelephora ganbajun]
MVTFGVGHGEERPSSPFWCTCGSLRFPTVAHSLVIPDPTNIGDFKTRFTSWFSPVAEEEHDSFGRIPGTSHYNTRHLAHTTR